MTVTPLRKRLEETYDELMFADGFDTAILGVVERCGSPPVVCYDTKRCIDILAEQMPYEDAVEFFYFNTAGAYAGPLTPMWLTRAEDVEVDDNGPMPEDTPAPESIPTGVELEEAMRMMSTPNNGKD